MEPTDRTDVPTWIMALRAAAEHENTHLPAPANHGMGSVSWQDESGDRMVTFRRRLVAKEEAIQSGIEWSFWADANTSPSCLATFRTGLHPDDSKVAETLSLMRGWLLDRWTPAEVERVIAQNGSQVYH